MTDSVLSPTAQRIFEMKYARTLQDGKKETWPQAVTRISQYVASAETNEATELAFMSQVFEVIHDRLFLPGGRVIANAGTGIKNLMNCFVLPIEDSRKSIYDTLGKAAEVFAWGGGVGYNFSHLREKGAFVRTTGGEASGPISFMSLFDQTGEVISQASRRGAQMGMLSIDHPDIETFINIKNKLDGRNVRLMEEYQRNLKDAGLDIDGAKYFEIMRKTLADDQLTHFNISVAITDEYMIEEKGKKLLKMIAENAWRNGDPGLYFIDRANQDNMVIYLGDLDATNPCGEVPLLPYEACCLGSINLFMFSYPDGRYDWENLRNVIRIAVRFLDNVQELNETPIEEINEATKDTRRLGLGVMGLADTLEELGLSYDSPEAMKFCDELARFIAKESWLASMDLAEERGAFPAFIEEHINWQLIDNLNLARRPVRNVAITSIAPTGSIALIADVNNGIEPFFAHSYRRNITQGVGNTAKETLEQAAVSDTVKTAHEIHWRDHINMQATWQKWTDNAVSKTINMPREASIEDVMSAYEYAWEQGLKGITVYRDGSKLFQILNR
jgi:ribonucleoside-diphosphate reductase alpha chain